MLPSDLAEKLSTLLALNGELPTAAKVIQDLLVLSRGTPGDLQAQTALLLSEPSLAIRLVHIARSEVSKPEQKPESLCRALACVDDEHLVKWAKSLVVVDRFSSAGRSGGSYESACAMAIALSLLIPALAALESDDNRLDSEAGMLLGWCASSGIFATVVTYPHLFDSVFTRMNDRGESFEAAIGTIIGFSSFQLSMATCGALDLPYGIPDILRQCALRTPAVASSQGSGIAPHVLLLQSAERLTHTMLFRPRAELGVVLTSTSEELSIDVRDVRGALAQLTDAFDARCATLGVKASLPDHVVAFSKGRGSGTFVTEQISLADLHAVRIDEIRESIRSGQPVLSVIMSAMEFLVWDFGFDRCVLMLTDSKTHKMTWSSYLGRMQLEPLEIEIVPSEKIQESEAPTIAAVKNALEKGVVIIDEQSLLPGGINTAIIPVGYRARALGVLYCDRLARRTELTTNEIATLASLNDVLDECVRLAKSPVA